jgi:hypothetical protein
MSSAHMPSSNHKLGAHFAAEHHRQRGAPSLPEEWENRVRDLEGGPPGGPRQGNEENTSGPVRPSIDDHRRQSVI